MVGTKDVQLVDTMVVTKVHLRAVQRAPWRVDWRVERRDSRMAVKTVSPKVALTVEV